MLHSAPFPTNVTGSAATLNPGRNINGVLFDGSANITVTAAAGTLSGTTLVATVVSSSLTSVGTLASLAVSGTSAFTGRIAVGGAVVANGMLSLVGNHTGSGTSQQAVFVESSIGVGATSQANAGQFQLVLTAGAANTTTARTLRLPAPDIGASRTIDTIIGLEIGNHGGIGGTASFSLKTGTGIVSFGDEMKLSASNTVNSSVLGTVTNKIKLNVGGTDYYLLANTSNA